MCAEPARRPGEARSPFSALVRRLTGGVLAMLVVLAGCSTARSNTGLPGSSSTTSGMPAPVTSRDLQAPGCSSAIAPARVMSSLRTFSLATPPSPFGVAAESSGHFAFVATSGGVEVLFANGPNLRFVRLVPLSDGRGLGAALTRDDQYLLVGAGNGAAVLSVPALVTGAGQAVLGYLAAGEGAIEVSVSADDEFAFLSLEYKGGIAVFNLEQAIRSHFHDVKEVSFIRLGQAVVGSALSPDGRFLYVTSEVGAPAGFDVSGEGSLSVISVARAVHDQSDAIVTSVKAGCQPVRVVVSDDGAVVWATARGSDAVLAWIVADLTGGDASRALTADVLVGAAPVGIVAAADGDLVVADSNRFSAAPGPRYLSIIDEGLALAGKPALLGQVVTAMFPRDMCLEAGGLTVLVTDFRSSQVQSLDLGGLSG